MMTRCRVAGGLLALLLVAGLAPGDIIHLKAGKVEGIIVKKTDTELVVETTAGKVTLNPADVVKIERKSSPLELYREMAREVKPNDADGHFKLGLWCLDSRLYREANEEFRKAIALEPDHEGARERLGYVRKDGKWMTRPEAKRADGFVKHGDRWITEEQRDKLERREAVIAWRKRFQQAVAAKPVREEAVAARIAALLRGRDSEAAAMALRLVLRDLITEAREAKRDGTHEARVALVEAVGDQDSGEATELVRWASIADPDAAVRAVAVGVLRAQKDVDNTAYFVGLLRHYLGAQFRIKGDKKARALARRVLRRSAEALDLLGDARAVPALANAMVVRFHIPEQQNQEELPPMNIGFTTNTYAGGNVITDEHGNQFVAPITEGSNWGVDDEARPKVESGFFFNDAAYSALRKLTRQDFGHSKDKWLAWWYRNRHDIAD